MIQGLITSDWRIGQLLQKVFKIMIGIQTIERGGHNNTVDRGTGLRAMGCFAEEKVLTIMCVRT